MPKPTLLAPSQKIEGEVYGIVAQRIASMIKLTPIIFLRPVISYA